MIYLVPEKVHDADKVFSAYVGNAARSLEMWGIMDGYTLRGIIDYGEEPMIFQCKIDINKFGLALLEEIIHDAASFINHAYRAKR